MVAGSTCGLCFDQSSVFFWQSCVGIVAHDGFLSINDSWPTRDPLGAIGPLKESMPRDAFRVMYHCMHFTDDFDKESLDEWSDMCFDEKHSLPTTARHCKKIGEVEDAICQR